jgi:hypothetical protein
VKKDKYRDDILIVYCQGVRVHDADKVVPNVSFLLKIVGIIRSPDGIWHHCHHVEHELSHLTLPKQTEFAIYVVRPKGEKGSAEGK